MTLMEKLKQQAAERRAAEARKEVEIGDISLRGTGITKRVIERDAKAYAREEKAAIAAKNTDAAIEAEKRFIGGIEETLEAMRRENAKSDIQLDESQIAAYAGILHNKVSVLIGAAGTGKTTLTKKVMEKLSETLNVVKAEDVIFVNCESEDGAKFRCLLREAKEQGYRITDTVKTNEMPGVALAAYTGRASQQIKRAVPEEWHNNISTIHRLLGYAPVFEDYDYIDPITGYAEPRTRKIFRPSFDHTCKLPFTFYVFDEGSMIPIPLFNEWVDAAPENSRVLIIGDIHQLPPPYGKGVLGYAMKKWPVFELKHIHRQAAGNAIITNAHKILNGRLPENAPNFHLIGNNPKVGKLSPTGQNELQGYLLGVIDQLSKLKNPKTGEMCYDPYKDNIIVPSNKNFCGTDQLNEKLVLMFNPEQKENGVIVNKRMKIHTGNAFAFFALRDKVMITKNINTIEPPITNGMLGIVESINLNGRYDQKRSQIEDDDGGDLDMGEIELDMGNLEAAFASLEDKDEKDDKDDASADQRQASHVMVIRFENGQTYECSTAGDYRAVKHGYATTCHKAQGGEYPNVIILCHSVNSVQLTQEWLYTAVTRARNNVYLVCNQRGLDQAVKRQAIKGYTLKDKIAAYALANDIQDTDWFDPNKHPILWEPKEI